LRLKPDPNGTAVNTTAAQLRTLSGCELVISGYPRFRYDAAGGGAQGTAQALSDGRWALHFPADQVRIPPLNCHTGRFLGIPLPPGLQIAIEPQQLEGYFDPGSGALELSFQARFRLQLLLAGRELYSAPNLLVKTQLSSAGVSSSRHQLRGKPLQGSSPGELVGVAEVPPCGAAWLDRFLGLPDEALAVLACSLSLNP
jgi:hypothetical protein